MRHPHVVKCGNEKGITSKVSVDSWGEALEAAKDMAKSYGRVVYIYTITFGGLKQKCCVTPDGLIHF